MLPVIIAFWRYWMKASNTTGYVTEFIWFPDAKLMGVPENVNRSGADRRYITIEVCLALDALILANFYSKNRQWLALDR